MNIFMMCDKLFKYRTNLMAQEKSIMGCCHFPVVKLGTNFRSAPIKVTGGVSVLAFLFLFNKKLINLRKP